MEEIWGSARFYEASDRALKAQRSFGPLPWGRRASLLWHIGTERSHSTLEGFLCLRCQKQVIYHFQILQKVYSSIALLSNSDTCCEISCLRCRCWCASHPADRQTSMHPSYGLANCRHFTRWSQSTNNVPGLSSVSSHTTFFFRIPISSPLTVRAGSRAK